jgi:hypothetical protein
MQVVIEVQLLRLQKLDGLSYEDIKKNVENAVKGIPKEKYRNIFKGAYERPERYESIKQGKLRRIIYDFSFKMGVLNEKGVNECNVCHKNLFYNFMYGSREAGSIIN